MSIYSALSFDLPVISYSVLHQVRQDVLQDDYIATMKNFHEFVREESRKVTEAWNTQRTSFTAKTIHSLRAHLTPFLSTPLKSDEEEIERHLLEALDQLSKSVAAADSLGAVATIEGKIVWDENLTAPLKKLSASGRKYLTELNFDLGKNRREIFESNFVIEGGLNLDILEHIVRDRMGIYTPVHGKHIKEFDAYAYAAHNLVYLAGDHSASAGMFEAVFFFSKGETRYAPFRNGAVELLDAIKERFHLPHISLWQRKLGLGVGREFIARFRFTDTDVLHDVVSLMAAKEEKPFVRDAFLASSHMLLKELFPILP